MYIPDGDHHISEPSIAITNLNFVPFLVTNIDQKHGDHREIPASSRFSSSHKGSVSKSLQSNLDMQNQTAILPHTLDIHQKNIKQRFTTHQRNMTQHQTTSNKTCQDFKTQNVQTGSFRPPSPNKSLYNLLKNQRVSETNQTTMKSPLFCCFPGTT